MFAYKSGQGVDSGQSLVSRGDSAPSCLFQIAQELSHAICRHGGHGETVDGLAGTLRNGRKQQLKSIAITALGIPGEIPFADNVFH